MRACLVLSVVAAVLAAPAVAYYNDHGLDGIASRLAGKKVQVRCLEQEEFDPAIASGASGYVEGFFGPGGRWYPKTWTVFAHGICEDLLAIAAEDLSGVLFEDAVWAVLVITHEAGHLKGARWSGDEARTHCWALKHMRSALNQLGVRDRLAHSMYVTVALELTEQMPFEYHLPNCKVAP